MRLAGCFLGLSAILLTGGFAPTAPKALTNQARVRTDPIKAFEIAIGKRESIAALKAIEEASTGPGSLNGLDPNAINWLDRSLADPAREARLASVLDEARYQPFDAIVCPDDLWLKRAVAVIGTDPAAAERALLRLCSPYAIALARLDGRFTEIVDQYPDTFDLKGAVGRTIKTLGAYANRHPGLAEPLISIALYEAMRGDHSAALAQLDVVISEPERFSDSEAQRSSALQYRAMFLGGVGRWDEAMADLRTAMEGEEEDDGTAYNRVSYAKALIDAGQSAEAWRLLETARPEFAYFQVNADEARVCALQGLGRRDEARQLFTTLAERRQSNRTAVFRALICLGDEDAVAAEAILWLAHPLWRQDMLLQLSDWNVASLSPGQVRRIALQRRLTYRPDVRAAVARAGRLERIDLFL